MRQYSVRDVFVGGSEAYMNSVTYEGPDKMMLHPNATGVAVVDCEAFNESNVSGKGKSRWRSYVLPPANQLRGAYLRILRNAGTLAEKEVTQPIQICGNDADYFYTEHGNYYWGQGTYLNTDTYEIVQRAAEFIPTAIPGDTGGADGISVLGFGGYDMHGRLSYVPGYDEGINPRFTFTRLGFENAMVSAFGATFDCCYFYHSFGTRGGWQGFNGCTVESQSLSRLWGDTRQGVGLSSETQEKAGYQKTLNTTSPPDGDPLFPSIGGPMLFFWGGGSCEIGGRFRVWRGFSCIGNVTVVENGIFMMPPDGSSYSTHVRDATIAITCKRGGVAYIDPPTLNLLNCSAALKVGIGATVALGSGVGQFSEVAGWNGNLDRRLEVNGGGKPTGDLSAIRDATTWG